MIEQRDEACYRSASVLIARGYTDREVKQCAMALSMALRHAVVAGRDIDAESILALLRACEPLEDVDALRLAYLRIGFHAHVLKGIDEALRIAEQAMIEHGSDERLRDVVERLRAAKKERG